MGDQIADTAAAEDSEAAVGDLMMDQNQSRPEKNTMFL
jgi:hypothetical protein